MENRKMATKNTSSIKKSLGLYKRHSKTKIQNVSDFLKDNAHLETLEDYHKNELLGLIKKLDDQVDKYENGLDESSQHLIEEDATLDEDKRNYDTLANEFEEVQNEQKQVKKDAFAFLDKSKLTGNAIVGATAAGTSSSKIDDTLKPAEILLRSMTLEEFNVWSDQFEAYYKQNERIFAGLEMSVRRAAFFKCLESNLTQALKTDPTITEETPVIGDNSCLSKLKAIFLKSNPLFLRRYNFQECVQKPNQSFPEWWALKLTKGQDCDLEHITRDEVLLLEMIRGVADPKLREEFLKQQNPTLDGLKAIAEQWHSANYISKHLGNDSVNVNKVSNYRSQKMSTWRQNSPHPKNQNKCISCGNSKSHSVCPAKDVKCFNCGVVGHFEQHCFNRSRQRSKSPGPYRNRDRSPSRSKPIVKNKLVKVMCAKSDNSAPTPLMDVIITPDEGTPFKFRVCPDSGAEQSIISYDLVKANGMAMNENFKIIKSVNDQTLDCSGEVMFEIEYQGAIAECQALVTNSISEQILLSHLVLKDLGVLPPNFPNRIRSVKAPKANDSVAEFITSVRDFSPKVRVEKAMEKYSKVFETGGPLKTMKGGQMKIHLKEGPIKPLHLYNARKTPYAFVDKAKEKLDEDESLGIIEKVTDVTEWCSAMNFVPKPNGKIRSTVDLSKLNEYVKRPTHPFPAPKDVIATIPPNAKVFSVFDALHGYWQIELDEKSRPLTTFITEFGRYQYKRAPMGLCSSGDEFCARTDKALSGIEGVKKLVDDILIFGSSYEELLSRICKVFARCEEWGITLSKHKFQLGESVVFAGFVISADGIKADPVKTEAIAKFKVPIDITNLRSFIGLANQLADFAPDLKHCMTPLQGLLSKKNAWLWTPEHDKAFQRVKDILTDPKGPVLKHFDPSLPVTLLTDASRTGLGFVILQKDHNGKDRLITCGSRFLSPAEKNYAVVELECLAITWAVLKCRLYLIGKSFEILTDHKPLLGIFNGKNIDAINNTRIQRMISKLLGFTFDVKWVPGKNHAIADALSRQPVFEPEETCDILVKSIQVNENKDPALEYLTTFAKNDSNYQSIVQVLKDKKKLRDLPKDHIALSFKSIWDSMSYDESYGLLLYHDRIIVPVQARSEVLEKLHLQHTGVEKTLRNARQLYFWPKMRKDIESLISKCQECIKLLPSQTAEPLIQTIASRPFEQVSIDLGKQNGTEHLILADRYSGLPMVKPLRKQNTKAIIAILDDWFCDFGKPLQIRSDGGPQFRDEFTSWCKENNIVHELSSAYHHESNGHAESAVREMKHLLEKTKSFQSFRKALLEYRSTPRYDGLSPAQWLFGRRQRTEAAALPSAYDRIKDSEIFNHESRRREEMRKQKSNDDQSSKRLPQLAVGDHVIVQNPISKRWDINAVIIEKRNNRSYIIRNENGKCYLRNRKFLRPIPMESTSCGQTDVFPPCQPILKKQKERSEQPLRRSTRQRKIQFRF